jgi:hypothetical protein
MKFYNVGMPSALETLDGFLSVEGGTCGQNGIRARRWKQACLISMYICVAGKTQN